MRRKAEDPFCGGRFITTLLVFARTIKVYNIKIGICVCVCTYIKIYIVRQRKPVSKNYRRLTGYVLQTCCTVYE